MFRGVTPSGVEERLDMLTGAIPSAARDMQLGDQSVLAQPLDEMPGAIERLFSHFGDYRKFLEQADINTTPAKFLLISGFLAAGGAMACIVARVHPGFIPLAAISLAVLPLVWVVFKRKRRLAAFAKQLPDALELIGRALRAGHSLAAGLQLVCSEVSDPLGKEFGRVYEEQNLGIPLEEALEMMTDRVPNLDLRFFVTAVILQRQTGGDLAEILDKIGHLIRERFQIWGQIQALTGEGRLSGIVLLALPPVLFIAMYRMNPDYIMLLFTDPLGKKMLAVTLVLQVLGALVIRKIVDIKV